MKLLPIFDLGKVPSPITFWKGIFIKRVILWPGKITRQDLDKECTENDLTQNGSSYFPLGTDKVVIILDRINYSIQRNPLKVEGSKRFQWQHSSFSILSIRTSLSSISF